MHQIHLHLPYLSQIIKNVRPIVSAGSTGTELWKTRDQYIKHQGGGGGGGGGAQTPSMIDAWVVPAQRRTDTNME